MTALRVEGHNVTGLPHETYPTKVQRIVNRIERSRWTLVSVEDQTEERGGLWIITAVKNPDHVLIRQDLRILIAVRKGYTIDGTDIRMRSSQRLAAGYEDAVLSHRELKTWRDVEIATYPREEYR